jgi:hypothetical protein
MFNYGSTYGLYLMSPLRHSNFAPRDQGSSDIPGCHVISPSTPPHAVIIRSRDGGKVCLSGLSLGAAVRY